MIDSILYLCVISGLCIAITFEVFQIPIKVAGSFCKMNALASNFSLKSLFINRIGATLYFPSIAYLIENGHKIPSIATLILSATLLNILICVLGFIFFRQLISYLCLKLFHSDVCISSFNVRCNEMILFAALASFFGLLGLTIPYFLSIFFFEYRLTLSNFSFVFNSIFTIITVFLIDRNLSELLDSNCDDALHLAGTIFLGRILGTALYFIFILSFSIFHISS
jgi:hypothetical protein